MQLDALRGVVHVVALSGGKDSTATALRLTEVEPRDDYLFVCTPTGNEMPAMQAHWEKLEALLGSPLLRLYGHPEGLDGAIDDHSAIPNHRMRWCTVDLKLKPYERFLAMHSPAVSYVGLRADEPLRIGGIYSHMPGVQIRYPLREWGWSVRDVRAYLADRGVEIPKRTDCAWCFFQRLIEWYELWRDHPEIYAAAEAKEAQIGHTFRSPGRDTWPAPLAELRTEFEGGRLPKDTRSALSDAKCRVCSL